MFQLEAMQAHDGDCFLLHYDADGKPGRILIDGGSAGIYTNVLKPRLEDLRGRAPVMNLRMVIVSHIDADHITGVLDLFREMNNLHENGESMPYKIQSLWHNAFGKLMKTRGTAISSSVVAAAMDGEAPILPDLDDHVRAVIASVRQGDELRRFATPITTINKESSGELIACPEEGKCVYRIADGLVFTILGPRQAELDDLEEEWRKSKAKKAGAKEESVAADYLNRTVPNLSSIVILAEKAETEGRTRRMLLTGDAGGDLILDSLDREKLLDADGKIKVDLLKVQHHGSNHSVDEDFFRRVIADNYVISGNGKHGIPHRDTLDWLSEARHGETMSVYMTNRDGDDGLTEMLNDFLKEEAREEPEHAYVFRDKDESSITVDV
jgi:beta-lactamase superfamily II metal-dependent hydrolase